MAQVSKFELADVKAFVADYAEKRGKNPSRTVVLEHFGGGNKERASELMKAAIAEIDAERAEASKVSEKPDSVKALIDKFGDLIWIESAKQSSFTAKALESALAEMSASMDTLKREHAAELVTLKDDLSEAKAELVKQTKDAELYKKECQELQKANDSLAKQREKLEIRIEVQTEMLDRKEAESKALNAQIAELTAKLAVAEASKISEK